MNQPVARPQIEPGSDAARIGPSRRLYRGSVVVMFDLADVVHVAAVIDKIDAI